MANKQFKKDKEEILEKEIPSLKYSGPQEYLLVKTPFGGDYIFSVENNWEITPNTWADLYFILGLDTQPINRNIIFSNDNTGGISQRRIPIFAQEIDPVILENQLKNEEEETIRNIYNNAIEDYKKSIFQKIAEGTLDNIPRDIEEKAIESAERKRDEYIASKEPKVETPLFPTDEGEDETPLVPTDDGEDETPLVSNDDEKGDEENLTKLPEEIKGDETAKV